MTRRRTPESLDLDMLAYDIADMLDRFEYPIDATQDEIRVVLPDFLAGLAAIVAQREPEADN